MQTNWETEVAQLLTELVAAQDDLFALLSKKRSLLMAADHLGLSAMLPEEEQLLEKMKDCASKREQLLARAAQEGMPSQSISALSNALPTASKHNLPARIAEANARTRLLHNESITNWIVIQRTMVHLSQMLEIIATGGRLQPTYGKGELVNATGSMLDRAA